MPLTSGSRLGAYEIVALLGAGGMGEVYRARDTRLDRTVAIKVLPSDVSAAPELRERFEREARTVAALNHPHICVLHDVGQQEGVDFLVMEYLEGETLQDRLHKGALPLDHALPVAIQVADALAAAHRAGVIHRDLKPANIFLIGKQGSSPFAKLLDFGLAKSGAAVATGSGGSMLPTAPRALTVQGTIFGTFQYVAPEQLEGLEADARSDIFAFGAVLYEMVTGRKAFGAKSQASLIAAILEHDPPALSTVRPAAPAQLEHVVRRCLAKSPDERWQTAADLRNELKWITESIKDRAPRASSDLHRPAAWRHPVPLGAALVLAVLMGVLGAIAAWMLPGRTPVSGSRVSRLSLVLPPGEELGGLDGGPAVAISPAGTHVAYVATRGGRQELFVRDVEQNQVRALGGTESATNPFFSPDGQWIGFFAQGKLKKVSVAAGTVQTLCDAPFGVGGSWGQDGNIYFAAINISGLSKASAEGGTPSAVTQLDRAAGEVSHRWPHVLPGGRAVMFDVWIGPARDEKQIQVQRLDTGERVIVVRGGETGRYVPSGHVVYARADELFALPFDLERLQTTGQPVRLPDIVRGGSEGAHFAVSETGDLVYVVGRPQRNERRLVWVDRDGRVDAVPAPVRPYFNAVLAPDGGRAAVNVEAGTHEIWIYDFTRATLTLLTTGNGSSQAPRWTPDGRRIVYRGTRTGFRNLWWNTVGETGGEERLATGENI